MVEIEKKILFMTFLPWKMSKSSVPLVAGKGMRFTEREYERGMWVEEEKELSCMAGVSGRFLCDIQVEARLQRSTDTTLKPWQNPCLCRPIRLYTMIHFCTHLTIKSNSEPASMRTPNKVEKAPSSTGANMCSSASTARLCRSPMAVRNAYKAPKITEGVTNSENVHRTYHHLTLTGLFAYQSNMNCKLNSNAHRGNQNDYWHSTQLDSHQPHEAKQLHGH